MLKEFGDSLVEVDKLAATICEARDTIKYVFNPCLMQQVCLQRTPRGRVVTTSIRRHFGLVAPAGERQPDLLD